MSNHNSLLEFYLQIYLRLHRDVAGAHASVIKTEYARDVQTIERRARSEGMSFFTKTLPRLGKAIDFALANGELLQSTGFRKKPGTQLPAFCWWLFSSVFGHDGRERCEASAWHLKQLRQLMFIMYKLELPYDDETVQKTESNSRQADNDLAHITCIESVGKLGPRLWPCHKGTTGRIARTARHLCHAVLGSTVATETSRGRPGLDLRNIIPRHGPGAVATGEKNWEKRHFSRIFSVLDRIYPFCGYNQFNLTHISDSYDAYDRLEVLESGTTKVVNVPKDSRGPRLISCEPLENQWIQQGQMRALVRHLEQHRLTSGHVNFSDQSINRSLALRGSETGANATIDMKEASDRVSRELVKYLFPRHVFECLDASRSTHMRYPDGQTIKLHKMSPMGSAVCFPIEAVVFWSLCVAVVMHTRNLTRREARKDVYVYGDDIICSNEDHVAIRHYLPKFGLMVNDSKCCTAGNFRESCGCDAYKGVDVTPLKLSTVWCRPDSPVFKTGLPTRGCLRFRRAALAMALRSLSSDDAGSLASHVAYSNALWDLGYCGTADYLEGMIQSYIPVPYFASAETGGIGFVRAHIDTITKNRELGFCNRFSPKHQLEVYGYGIKSPNKVVTDSGWEEMHRVQSYTDLPSLSAPYPEPNVVWYWDPKEGRVRFNVPPQSVEGRHYAVRGKQKLVPRWIDTFY